MLVVRLLLLTVALNVVRYLVGGSIEAVTIMEPMHAMMPNFPEVFNNDFSTTDFASSFGYNFTLWFAAVLAHHFMRPSFAGHEVVRSLKAFGVSLLAFVSLAAVYMNHFLEPIRSFFFWSLVDSLILFPVVAVACGLLYPRFMGKYGNGG